MEQFLDNIKDLEVTTVARAQEALDKKETATFFIGRKTCPYCRKFAGTLAGVWTWVRLPPAPLFLCILLHSLVQRC